MALIRHNIPIGDSPFDDIFPADEPVPEQNPTGLYRHCFELPEDFVGERYVLEFTGVEAGCYSVWLNGHYIGLGKDSRLPSTFDITKHLQPGKNILAVQCIKWACTTA